MHPELGELLAAQQLVDQLVALVGGRVGHELAVFLDGRQHADDVDVCAAQELFVVAQFATARSAAFSAWR